MSWPLTPDLVLDLKDVSVPPVPENLSALFDATLTIAGVVIVGSAAIVSFILIIRVVFSRTWDKVRDRILQGKRTTR